MLLAPFAPPIRDWFAPNPDVAADGPDGAPQAGGSDGRLEAFVS